MKFKMADEQIRTLSGLSDGLGRLLLGSEKLLNSLTLCGHFQSKLKYGLRLKQKDLNLRDKN